MRTGIYPGTFDPVTFGHLDIVRRAAKLVDKLIVGVAVHSGKDALFSVEQRVDLVQQSLPEGAHNITVLPMPGLLADFAKAQGAQVLLRGLRAVSDFEYELQMAMMNARLDPELETVFLMTSERQQFIASRLVKEVAQLGGDVSGFVPAPVVAALRG